MKRSKAQLIEYYNTTLQEIKKERERLDIEWRRIQNEQDRLHKEQREKSNERIKNGTATILDYFELNFKSCYFFNQNRTELNSLTEKARELAIILWGEDVAFPTIRDFLIQVVKRIKKLLKYLIGKLSDTQESIEDKRPFIAQFRKLLIKVNQDDVDNSTTRINKIINRVLNFNNKEYDDVIKYQESYYQHFDMQ